MIGNDGTNYAVLLFRNISCGDERTYKQLASAAGFDAKRNLLKYEKSTSF